MLLSAVAAAGLIAVPVAAHDGVAGNDEQPAAGVAPFAADSGDGAGAGVTDTGRTALGGETREAVDDSVTASPVHADHQAQDAGGSNDVAGAHNAPTAPAELLQGTDAAEQSNPAGSTLVADGVAMASAEMLLAAHEATNAQAVANSGDAQSTAEVSRVLADALGGGGHGGLDIDALLHAATGHGGAPSLAELIAGHSGPAGAAWDTSGFATLDLGVHMLVTHMDAPPLA